MSRKSQDSGIVPRPGSQYPWRSGPSSTGEEAIQRRTPMSSEENKALVRRFVEEFWNQGNTAAADELMTDDATIILPGRGQVSKETFKEFVRTMRSAFPDWYS